MKVIRDRLLVQ